MSEHKNLATALLGFQAEAPTLRKDASNPHFGSKYTPLDTIVETVRPLLAKHGLVWYAMPSHGEGGSPALVYTLQHAASGESITGQMPLLLDKQNAQGLGSALTYARRYALTSVLNLVSDDDDDGNAASRSRQAQPTAAPADPSAPPLASPQERAAIKARADERNVPPTELAMTLVRAAGGDESKYAFDSQAAATAWVDKALERLPKAYVKAVLTELDAALI